MSVSYGTHSDTPFLPPVGYILRRGQNCSCIATEHLLFPVLIKWKIIRNEEMAVNSWSLLCVSPVCEKSIAELFP